MTLGMLAITGCASTFGGTRNTPPAPQAAQTDENAIDTHTRLATRKRSPAAEDPSGGIESTSTAYLPGNTPNISLTPPILHELLVAELAMQRQQPGMAWSNYHELATQTGDARLARRATELALVASNFRDALDSARLWQQLDPLAPEAGQTLDTLLLANGQTREAEPGLTRRLAQARADKTLPVAYQQIQRMLLNASNHREAWATVQRLSEPDLKVPAARLARARLAAAAGEREAAADEALAAHQLDANDPEAVLIAAQLLQPLQGGPQRATRLLTDYLDRHPDDARVRMALGGQQLISRQDDAAIATFRRIPDNDQQTPAAYYTLAQIYFQKKDLDKATDYLKRYVALPGHIPRDNGPAYLFLAEIAEARNVPAEAIDWLESIPAQSPFRLEAVARRAVLIARTDRPEAGLALLATQQPQTPREQQLVLVTRAQILRDASRYQEAFDTLDRAVKNTPDNTDLLYDHAIAAEKIKRLDVLEKSLRTLIERRPDNAHAYNALGYTFADHNIRLSEALELIQQANRLMPNNAHVLDSLGWVYYRMGRLPEALDTLRQAFELQPDAEVAIHYGEVLWMTGQKEEARKMWQHARKEAPDNPLLKNTLKRLGASL